MPQHEDSKTPLFFDDTFIYALITTDNLLAIKYQRQTHAEI